MIKIKIQAGLGNQMFQYALARSIKERTKKKVVLDLSFYNNGVAKGDTIRGYDLDKFNISEDFNISYKATPKIQILLEKIIRRIFKLSSFVFYDFYKRPIDGSYLIGFWQSEKYFKDIENIIRKEFTLKNPTESRNDSDLTKEILNKILDSKYSISINVRRGDYANNPKIRNYHGLLSKDYFLDGIKFIKDKLSLNKEDLDIFVFSDDIDWCQSNLLELEQFGKIVFVPSSLHPADSIYLISLCKSNVIANSSFSWWGAWLNNNKEKIIVAPKYWMKGNVNTKDVVPEDWIRLESRFY
jgi:hypothetical protein